MSQAPAWWEDVEHLREAAERRIAERERAQREGREPVALPPLRPLSDGERVTATDVTAPAAPRPLAPPPRVREGRFRRATAALGSTGPRATAAATATATMSAAPTPRPRARRCPPPRPPALSRWRSPWSPSRCWIRGPRRPRWTRRARPRM